MLPLTMRSLILTSQVNTYTADTDIYVPESVSESFPLQWVSESTNKFHFQDPVQFSKTMNPVNHVWVPWILKSWHLYLGIWEESLVIRGNCILSDKINVSKVAKPDEIYFLKVQETIWNNLVNFSNHSVRNCRSQGKPQKVGVGKHTTYL